MKSKLQALLMTFGLLSGAYLTACNGCCLGEDLWRFNPCGTILPLTVCTPEEWYARVFDGPDWDVDPGCAIPGQCGNLP